MYTQSVSMAATRKRRSPVNSPGGVALARLQNASPTIIAGFLFHPFRAIRRSCADDFIIRGAALDACVMRHGCPVSRDTALPRRKPLAGTGLARGVVRGVARRLRYTPIVKTWLKNWPAVRPGAQPSLFPALSCFF